MPVFIEEVEFVPEKVQTGTYTDYLVGNIFQKITLTVNFRSELYIQATTLAYFRFGDTSFKRNANGDFDWVTAPTSLNLFADLNIDDIIVFTSGSANSGTYRIREKLSNSEIRLETTLGVLVSLTTLDELTGTIELKQDPLGFTLDFGLIENSEAVNYNSKVTNDLMRYEFGAAIGVTTIPSLNPTTAVGRKDWQLGSCILKNLTTTVQREARTYKYQFEQILYIHPFYLPNQILDITNPFPIPPNYFNRENCLKYVGRIRMYRELQDPNVFQEGVIEDKAGQTGWFDEEFNGGNPRYYAQSFAYTGTLTALDTRKVNSITFEVITDTSLISTGNAEWVTLNFIVLPEKNNDYINRNQLQQENFVFDRAQAQAAAIPTAVNGERFATGYQVFKNVLATVTGLNTVEVTADIDFGTDAVAKINTLSNGGYMLSAYASVGDSEPADAYHAVTMLLDVNNMETEITTDVIDVNSVFLYHDQNDNTTVTGGSTVKVEDEIVAETVILLDHTSGTGYPGSQIDTLSGQIVAKKSGEDDVVLLDTSFAVSGNQLIGAVRDLNANPATGFQVNPTELRHNFRAYRSTADDVTDKYGYRVQYPFLYRWEYWEQLILSKLPADFYSSAEQFNGYNNEWFRLQALTGWDIYYRLATTISFLGVTNTVNTDKLITPIDYLGNADWDTETIESFDGATPLTYLTNPYIMQNKQTTINANFTYVGSSLPATAADVYMVARLIPKENGSYIANQSLSSVYDREDKGIFIGDSTGKIAITKVGSIFTGTFDIDYNEIPTGILEYTLSVSIGVNSTVGMTDFGEVQKKDMLVLRVIDFNPPEIPKDVNPFKTCCYPLGVFGNIADKTDKFKNDFSSPLLAFPLQYAVTQYLEKFNDSTQVWGIAATLTGNTTLGTDYPLGFKVQSGENYIGYKVNWGEVLDAAGLGEGKYRVKFDAVAGSLYSEEYCLEQFTLIRANNTIRITYNWDSLIGDKDQKLTRNFVGFNWINQVRLRDAQFGNKTAAFETEDVRYQNGELQTVSKSFSEKYTLSLYRLPTDIFNLVLYNILLADTILISDYNRANFENYIDHSVEIDGSIEPNYDGNRPEVSLIASFKSKYDNNIKFYS
jgi:hypothetical protein